MVDVSKFYKVKSKLSSETINFFKGAMHNNKTNNLGFRFRIRAPKGTEIYDCIDPSSKKKVRIFDYYDVYFDELVRLEVITNYKKYEKRNRKGEKKAFLVIFS